MRNCLTEKCKEKLSEEKYFSSIVIDNNQKGEILKQQRESKSSSFSLVDCVMLVQLQNNSMRAALIDDASSARYVSKNIIISHTNQAVPSPYYVM